MSTNVWDPESIAQLWPLQNVTPVTIKFSLNLLWMFVLGIKILISFLIAYLIIHPLNVTHNHLASGRDE